MKLPKQMQEIIEDFKLIESPTEKYDELLSYAEELNTYPEDKKKREYQVPGCMSEVYVFAESKDNTIQLYAWSDSLLVKGMIALLITGLEHMPTTDFLELTPEFIEQLEVTDNLTASRGKVATTVLQMFQEQIKQQIK